MDALLSCRGIIPSLSELQLKLITLIDLFSKALISEGECEQFSDGLCNAICCYLDSKIASCLDTENIAWDRYSLTQHFYGYQHDDQRINDKLETLLAKGNGKISVYAGRLLALTSSRAGKAMADCPRPLSMPITEEPLQKDPITTHRAALFFVLWQIIIFGVLLGLLWLVFFNYLDRL